MNEQIGFGFGDPAPSFVAATSANPRYHFDLAAGRYLALCFFGTAAAPVSAQALAMLSQRPELFDGERIAFFGVSIDPNDRTLGRVHDSLPGVRFVWDFDRAVSTLYGAVEAGNELYRGFWLVLDPMLRVIGKMRLTETEQLIDYLAGLPPVDAHATTPMHAPVLILPRVFEPGLCEAMIELHRKGPVEDSGFMQEIGGRTTPRMDHAFKRRTDHQIEDEAVRAAAGSRILRRLIPEIAKTFQFQATRMERYLVACYDAGAAGRFAAHRDNTTKGTAHRRFAVTVNLNAEDYEGGDLRFPEFGTRTYRAPTGGAVVFSCSLLHEAMPVTAGRRYAFLPFLYDEAGASLREANNEHLAPQVSKYARASVN